MCCPVIEIYLIGRHPLYFNGISLDMGFAHSNSVIQRSSAIYVWVDVFIICQIISVFSLGIKML